MNAAALRALFADSALRVTRPRLAVVAALQRQRAPIDAQRLHAELRGADARTSLGTVYRTLRELERLALVDVQVAPHGRLRWRLREAMPPFPALPADASAQGPSPVARLAEQAARLGYRLIPLAPHGAAPSQQDIP